MTRQDSFRLEAEGIQVDLDLDLGQIASLSIRQGDRVLSPFHRVPWADSQDDALFEGTDPHLRRMSIDFFGAPFTLSDVEPAPYHGWPANSSWHLVEVCHFERGVTGRFQLDRDVMGTRLVKELTLRDHHPFLYQNHIFKGGSGKLPVGYHAMVSLPGEAFLSFSPKLEAMTPETALEPDPARGTSLLRYPSSSSDIHAFPMADGRTADLARYPLADRHDDLVMLVEDPANSLGWSVAARPQRRDLALVLKSPKTLPFTILWYSNGGRFYPPWNGRHVGVLGVEEVCAFMNAGHKASAAPNGLSERGFPTAAVLGGDLSIRSVIGAVDWIVGAETVREIKAGGKGLIIRTADGEAEVNFDGSFLA
ncbi:hypothetical protein [Acidisoma silvae]|uniref:DUF4432 family protein n=1 Tax=Acidisoma silvae TaxID=2802396 RepID=A0A963YV77_9PROT|nr:hypothetical protein [Acidisoma silvae]MCB8877678.1 hypothetical protein [Acidisoma silvae]